MTRKWWEQEQREYISQHFPKKYSEEETFNLVYFNKFAHRTAEDGKSKICNDDVPAPTTCLRKADVLI